MVVIVLGMHRSGTSALAGALHKCGVWMGASLLQADENNPWGYYEDTDVVAQNEQILRAAGGTWWNPPPVEKIQAMAIPALGMLAKVVRKRGGRPQWGFKDPRTVLTLPLWLRVLKGQEVNLVRVTRPTDDIVASLLQRHSTDGEWWLKRRTENEWAALVEEYKWRLESYNLPMLKVKYKKLLENPKAELEQLCWNLGVTVTPEAVAHVRGGTNA